MLRLRTILLTAFLILTLSSVGYADATLRSAIAEAGVGSLICSAVNVGKKTLDFVNVRLIDPPDGSAFFNNCADLAPGRGCSVEISAPLFRFCEILVTGGGARTVRGGLTVQGSDGNSVLFLPATK